MKKIINIELSKLKPNPQNARSEIDYSKDDPSMQDLIADIKVRGLVTPLKVLADGRILFGNRRFYAAKHIGLDEVPCWVDDSGINDVEQLLQQVSENMIRKYPSSLERGRAFYDLIDSGAATLEDIKGNTGAKDIEACIRTYKNFLDARKKVGKKRTERVMEGVRKRPDYSTIAKVVFKRTGIPSEQKVDLLEEVVNKKGVTGHHIEKVTQELQKKATDGETASRVDIEEMLSKAMETDEHNIIIRKEDWDFFKEDWKNLPVGPGKPATLRHYFIEILRTARNDVESAGNYNKYVKGD